MELEFTQWTKENRKLNNLAQLKKEILQNFEEQHLLDKPIIAMLSGGKDSSTALAIAKDLDLNIKLAVHFVHRWSWELPKTQVQKITNEYGVPLTFYDITEVLCQRIQGGHSWGKNICKICKTIMKEKIREMAYKEKAHTILTGESALEKIAGPIFQYVNETYRTYEYSKMELTPVPKKYRNIKFFRPLIRCGCNDIEALQKHYNVKIERVGEVGNKIGYWREGCCLQYCNLDAKMNTKLFDDLYYYNNRLTALARKYGFRASIKMPSKDIIVLPKKKEYIDLVEKELKEIEKDY